MERLRNPAAAGMALALAALLAPPAADAEAPESFGVPDLRPGDGWTYVPSNPDGLALATPDAPFDGWVLAGARYRVGLPATLLDADGRPTATATLLEEALYRSADGEDDVVVSHAYHTAGGRPVARTWTGALGGGGAIFGLTLPDGTPVTQAEQELVVANRTLFDGRAPFCGFENGFQGEERDPARPLRAAGACPRDGATLRAAGTATSGGARVVVMETASGDVQLGFRADVPVPVRIVQPAAWNASLQVVLDLVEFSSGDPAPALASQEDTAPPAAFAPAEPWGPSEEGVEYPFPLSAAWQAASGSRAGAAFLASHPTAYLQSAAFHELRYEEGPYRELDRVWTLQATDGREALRLRVERAWHAVAADGSEETLPAPPQDNVTVLDPEEGPFPDPSTLPALLPTVASTLARWEAYRADGRSANGWGFAYTCDAPDCPATRATVTAGRDLRSRPLAEVGVLVLVSTDRRDASLTTVDGAGRTAEHLEARPVAASSLRIGDVELGDPPAWRRASAAPGGSAPDWAWVAGWSAVGLLAVAAWAAWTLLKGGGVALWHRPTGEHPLRQAILDLAAAEPGIHHQEMMRRLGKGNSVLTHHLGALRRTGKLTAVKGPRYLCYFPRGAVDHRLMAAAPVLKAPLARRILGELARGPASNQELAARLGVGASSITWHVKRIQAAGLLEVRRDGRSLRLTATELGVASLGEAAAGS